MYFNNICICGKVSDVIEEDEEEYDDEGKICPNSYTGNHHFKGGSLNCKYCGIQKTNLMTIRKSIKKANRKDSSFMNNNPFVLEENNIRGSVRSLFHQKEISRQNSKVIVMHNMNEINNEMNDIQHVNINVNLNENEHKEKQAGDRET